ncbi:hypothetical protein PGT21_002071 [Puccinia graminis f. sp. tritici]|uniref:RING-type domain-containing protein n=1 Tax=Puccinia graminis f. sp. tritici TaxID=56615 RepID=A0A5B0RT33_PUCGR|nr:hypothetical protein PGT21_002071 [Puccinia graminis f. sp. tritici]KAA1128033.1 hypothetical protein PGTUg99_013409 [Puccinia graminis f. sp. tritici]
MKFQKFISSILPIFSSSLITNLLPQAAALVPGSKSIATEEVFSEARDLPRDKQLVEHSTSHDLSGSLKSEESSKCAICQKNLGREGVKELQCGHTFHQTGLDRWAIENPVCPLCREEDHSLVIQHQEHKMLQEAKERERQIEEQNRIQLQNERARQEEITRDISYQDGDCLICSTRAVPSNLDSPYCPGCGKPIHELCLNRWLHGSTTYICPACSTDYLQWHQDQLSDDIDLEAHEHDALTHLTDHEGQGQAHLLRDSSAFSSLVSSRKRMREYASENEREGLSLASSSHTNKQRAREDPTREDHDCVGSE